VLELFRYRDLGDGYGRGVEENYRFLLWDKWAV